MFKQNSFTLKGIDCVEEKSRQFASREFSVNTIRLLMIANVYQNYSMKKTSCFPHFGDPAKNIERDGVPGLYLSKYVT